MSPDPDVNPAPPSPDASPVKEPPSDMADPPEAALEGSDAPFLAITGWAVSLALHTMLLGLFALITWQQEAPASLGPMEVGTVGLDEIDDAAFESLTAAASEMDTTIEDVSPAETEVLALEPTNPFESTAMNETLGTTAMAEPIIGLSEIGGSETNASEEWSQLGGALDNTSDLPMEAAGGMLGYRTAEGRRAARQFGATTETEAAVEAGLRWLAAVQENDGRWDSVKWKASGSHDVSCTGLALLAFLGAGYAPGADKYDQITRDAIQWLINRQDQEGSFRVDTFYEQGIAAMALCEAYTMTNDTRYRGPAQAAIDHILWQMGSDGGYGYDGPGNDLSVAGWQIMAVKSAIIAGLDVPAASVERMKDFLALCAVYDGQSKYRSSDRGPGSPAMTAVGMMCRLFLDYGVDDSHVLQAAKFLNSRSVDINDEYYTYYATYCMFHMGGDRWHNWNRKFRSAATGLQIKGGALRGSWDPQKGKWGGRGGRVYMTGMYLMALEVYYRYLPVYRTEG